jgi:16S rRNA (cytosine1402-N4)-methyltransferase
VIHLPVLLHPIIDFLEKQDLSPKNIVDCTFGRGGHCRAFLDKYTNSKVFAFDRDQEALDYAHAEFGSFEEQKRFKIVKNNFSEFPKYSTEMQSFFSGGLPDLILLDLGVSSPQLDVAERGFSFYHDGPLDMRMDRDQSWSAFNIINEWDEKELSDIFYHLGEIRFPNKVVREIANQRKIAPIKTTEQLVNLIIKCEGWRKKGKHPATQYFMGLRIRVNEELESLRNSLSHLINHLAPKGLLMVISFHSMEDRIVKNHFKSSTEFGRILTKKVIQAEGPELKDNPRARSAKLRIFQRGEY